MIMHSLLLKTNFIAQHFLIGKDFGRENFNHSHQYHLELEIKNQHLDQFNYVVDIVAVKENLDTLIDKYKDKKLNDLTEFTEQNPSLELFSKILWQDIISNFNLPKQSDVIVRLWEDDIACASYWE